MWIKSLAQGENILMLGLNRQRLYPSARIPINWCLSVCELWWSHLSRGNINKNGVLTDVKIIYIKIKLAQQSNYEVKHNS